jgi:methionyl-tRNA formyltransferase
MLVAMSIVFIGTPDFAVPSLRRLAADGHVITVVITQPDRPAGRGRRLAPPPVKVAAEELGLAVLQPPTLRDAEPLDAIRALQPEAIVAVAYGQILRQELLDIPPRGVLNVHPSLLPRHRGASPIAGAILAGDDETGVSIMLMDAGMDSGPILAQRRVPIAPEDTTLNLTPNLAELGADLLAETLPRWLASEIEPQPQDARQATVTQLIRKENGVIDWSLPAIDIWRRVRAYHTWPGATTTLDGEPLLIRAAWSLAGTSREPPGTIVAMPPGVPPKDVGYYPPGFAVQTGDGLIAIITLQPAGRIWMSSNEFLRGRPGIIGRQLGSPKKA